MVTPSNTRGATVSAISIFLVSEPVYNTVAERGFAKDQALGGLLPDWPPSENNS